MAGISHPIALVPEDVRLKISASQQITSHVDVVEGLVENALDADARSISVEVNFAKGYFSVRDDGVGIEGVEFTETGRLARPHCTSKLSSSHPTFGRYGRFLSSLSLLSLLSITSRRQSESGARRLILHRGEVVSRQLDVKTEDGEIVGHGTTVVVHNLFGDVPVRSRYMFQHYSSPAEISKGFDQLKRRLVGYLLAGSKAWELRLCLAHGNRQHIHVKPGELNSDRVTTEGAVSTLFQARMLSSPDSASWKPASIRSKEFLVRAVFSLEPYPCRDIQYISIGQHPITNAAGNKELFDVVNQAFQRSNFGSVAQDRTLRSGAPGVGGRSDRGQEVTSGAKCVDRWPMFCIKVEMMPESLRTRLDLDQAPGELRPAISRLFKALELLVSHFLESHGYDRYPRGLQPGKSQIPEPRTPSSEETSSLRSPCWRPQGASQIQQLKNWHRVKSGLHSSDKHPKCRSTPPERAPGPQPLADSVRNGHLSPDNGREDRRIDDDLDAMTSSTNQDERRECETDATGEDKAASTLVWTDPRNGRVVHLHPLTGSVVPDRGGHAGHLVRTSRLQTCSNRRSHAAGHLSSIPSTDRVGAALQLPARLSKYSKVAAFRQAEPSIQSSELVGQPMTQSSKHAESACRLLLQYGNWQVTKESLACSTIVRQVDQKFILAIVPTMGDRSKDLQELLILVDQHAADERVRLESLYQDLCQRKHCTLEKPIVFDVGVAEAELFEGQRKYFEEWCFTYEVEWNHRYIPAEAKRIKHESCTISVTTLPALIAERCQAEPSIVVNLLRDEVWSRHSSQSRAPEKGTTHKTGHDSIQWVSEIGNCPMAVLEMLKSRSCRTAVMFNDKLDLSVCGQLVHRLARCAFPFQCAHGRPTVTVLGALGGPQDHVKSNDVTMDRWRVDDEGFRAQWTRWMDVE